MYALYVHPSVFGSGAGTALLSAAAGAVRKRGHRAMCVWVLTDNERALNWYRRRGAMDVATGPITLAGVAYPQTALVWRNLATVP